ncbi:MAG: hypothetical protein ACLQL2_05240 [Methylovirgula sp.]
MLADDANSGEISLTTISETALGPMEKEGRLLNAVLKGETKKPGRFGFRGDIALKWQEQVADEKRPPDFSLEGVLTIARQGEPTLPILVGYIHSFAYLENVVDVIGNLLSPDGIYLIYANNIDLLAKYRLIYRGIPFFVLPCDESTVWKETTDLLSIDKNDIKKLDTAAKLDYVLDALAEYKPDFTKTTFEEVLATAGPIKNRNENRPV